MVSFSSLNILIIADLKSLSKLQGQPEIAAVDTSSKDLKEKKEVVEEAEDGGDAPANRDTEIEEDGEQEADNEVEEEEDIGKEEKEGDGEEENGEDEEAEAAEDEEEEDADTKKQKTNEDDYTAKKEKLHLTKLNLFTLRLPSQTLNVVTLEDTARRPPHVGSATLQVTHALHQPKPE
ncbi:prothymosin alpha-like [Neomonachus schauinslandi]|uniref:Prothymosin alpha n=1 Tax=Neomonachus schauinslandi TaxID=29088 RepID=A0A8M1MLE9_NEOSC|nr:prothymosin alpha-like [Neomonachus schauinslandi]